MSIAKKIEKIRKQPEHIRMQWVWGCVIVSMLFIFAIWLFSINAMIRRQSPPEKTIDTKGLEEQFQNMKDQSKSLKDYVDMPIDIENELKNGESASENSGNLPYPQYPSSDGNSENLPPSTYSDLKNTQ